MTTRVALLGVLAVSACWQRKPPPAPTPDQPLEQPTDVATPTPPAPPTRTKNPGSDLYDLDEALADASIEPWTFVGTGEWYGMFRVNACVYRNERVFIVNPYCTLKEKLAASVVVLHPERGRVVIYAEGDAPTSTTQRSAWLTFKGESHVPTDPPLRLDFTYAQLRAWDEARYNQSAPACYTGTELRRPLDGCYKLDPAREQWTERNADFLREPPPAYFALMRELRDRALQDARPYSGP